MNDLVPTETLWFTDGEHKLAIHVENSNVRFAWQLEVNNDFSHVTTHYTGILEHCGYCVATAYWEGTLPVFVPFKIVATAPTTDI